AVPPTTGCEHAHYTKITPRRPRSPIFAPSRGVHAFDAAAAEGVCTSSLLRVHAVLSPHQRAELARVLRQRQQREGGGDEGAGPAVERPRHERHERGGDDVAGGEVADAPPPLER